MKINLDSMNKNSSPAGFISRFALPILIAVLFIVGCDREEEPIPVYLTVEPFELQATDMGRHGSISHKITHANLFMFDSIEKQSIALGVFELPATVPVTNKGQFSLNVDPVIKANGSSLSLQAYPFYSRYSETINLESDAPLTIMPTTRYLNEAVFEVIEDFEGSGTLFSVDRDNNPMTAVERTSDDAFEGQYAGRIRLDTANASVVVQTEGLFDLAIGSAGKAYIELNYKTDVPLEFGVIPVEDNGQEGELIGPWVVLAKSEWNKIYFDITNAISSTGSLRFAILMSGELTLDTNGKYSLLEAEILIDNFKLVHF